jgi:hypothetical protein
VKGDLENEGEGIRERQVGRERQEGRPRRRGKSRRGREKARRREKKIKSPLTRPRIRHACPQHQLGLRLSLPDRPLFLPKGQLREGKGKKESRRQGGGRKEENQEGKEKGGGRREKITNTPQNLTCPPTAPAGASVIPS